MHLPKIEALSETLLMTDRKFLPRTPHSYSHLGQKVLRRIHLLPSQAPGDMLGANVQSLNSDLPEAILYYFPEREQ